MELTIKEVDLPIDQTFTFWSSPPVAKSRQVFFPILRQFTLPEWATNSSISNQVKKTNWSNNNYNRTHPSTSRRRFKYDLHLVAYKIQEQTTKHTPKKEKNWTSKVSPCLSIILIGQNPTKDMSEYSNLNFIDLHISTEGKDTFFLLHI